MKKTKCMLSFLLVFTIIVGMIMIVPIGASADTKVGADSKIYFEVPIWWQNYKDIRLYLYEVGGDVLIPWNSEKGKMTYENNGKWSFDMSKFPMSDSTIYACIFLTNTEAQTCDMYIGNPCLGDTAYCTGENNIVENTIDANKKSWEVKWRNADPRRWGAVITSSSLSNKYYPVVSGDTKIYFEVPSWWTNYKDIRLYLYEVGGDAIIPWNSKMGRMTEEGDGRWSYNLSEKGITFRNNKTYACNFLTNTEAHTCEIFVGNPCLGDTAYCIGEKNKIESTVNSNTKCWEVKWCNADPNRWGIPLAITPNGNVVGSVLPEGTTKYDIFLNFLMGSGYAYVNNAVKYNGKTVQWTIDDAAIALDLSMNDVKKALKECGVRYDWYESLSTIPVTSPSSVKLNRSTLGLGVGENYGLVKTVSPSNANQTVTWSSSNTNVATVGSSGNVFGKASGTANITLKTSNGKTATCKVTVKPAPTSVKTNPASLTLSVGESYTISESTNSGSYANAANLKWSSSNTKVVTVTKTAGTNKAVLKATGTGTANVTIKTYNGKTATCKVTVKPAPASVKTNPASLTLGKGETYTVSESTDSGSYANAANLKWSSSNTNVVTVTKTAGTNKAVLKATGTGTANVTIKTYNGKTATCKVTVKPAPTSVKTNPATLTLNKGKTYTISESTNSGSYANAANLKWTSSNTKVATVTKGSGNKATVKAVAKGTAYIKITLYNGKTAQCKVTVK